MPTLAHVSDLHFGAHDPRLVDGLLDALRAFRPDLIVVSGDLTQRALPAEFRDAADFLAALPAPYLVVPGNHDVPANPFLRFTRPFGRYRRHIGRELCPRHVDGDMAVLGLNSARAFGWHWSWAHGRLNLDQIALAERMFRDLPGQRWRILVTHHPFLPPPTNARQKLVGRAAPALEAFERAGVDLLLAGHLHLNYRGDVRSHHARIKRSILVIQAATATSTRLRDEPNAFNMLRLAGPELHLQDWVWDGERFRPGAAETFVHRHHSWQPEGTPVAKSG